MASSKDFVQYVAEQCSMAREVVARKMFGDCDYLSMLVCETWKALPEPKPKKKK
ncbi:MAG: hypothetical protein IJS63_04275 [Bacteroidaceae bacterium]|nr:hypothetical protein [Bacteroidaceae bacterium]